MSLAVSFSPEFDSPFVASVAAPITSLAVLQSFVSFGLSIPIRVDAGPAEHTVALQQVLSPLRGQSEIIEQLAFEPPIHEEFGTFLETEGHQPSEPLLTVLHGRASDLKTAVEKVSAQPLPAGGMVVRKERRPLEYAALSETAIRRHDQGVEEAVARMLARRHEGARTSLAAVPKAVSLKDILERPDDYKRGKPLEIVLFDVDGTTHLGETFLEGQYSIEWLARDILRYGPRATSGLGWWRILRAIPGIIKLRLQEKREGHADRGKFDETIGPLLKGLDGRLAEESLRRYFQRYGSRGVSGFMQSEFTRHRQEGRLIIGVSASPEFLVQLHAQKDLSIPTDNMLGTTIEINAATNKATGKFRWLHGEEKVAALEERVFGPLHEKGIPFRVVAGYSDSPSDTPMLERVREDGGIVYVTNTSKDAFKTWALESGGMCVEEDEGWGDRGTRKVTIFSFPDDEDLNHTKRTPPRRPEWVKDFGQFAVRTLGDGAGFAVAAPVSEAARQALAQGGHVDWSWHLLSSSPGVAAAGMVASAATAFFVPPDGPVSWPRRVLLRGMIPVAAAMAATGNAGSYGIMAALATALLASASVELVTGGERMTGLRRWKGGDERKNPIGRTVGFAGLRTLQLIGFRAIMYGLQRLIGT